MKKISLIFWVSLIFSGITLNAQILEPVKWAFSLNQLSESEYEIIADATIEEGWHLYSSNIPEGGPIATSVTLVNSDNQVMSGDLREEPEADVQYDQAFDMELSWFSNEARLILPVTISGTNVVELEGYVEFMACDDEQCLPPDRLIFLLPLMERQMLQSKPLWYPNQIRR